MPHNQLGCDLTWEVPADEQLELELMNSVLPREQQTDLHTLLSMSPQSLRETVMLHYAGYREMQGLVEKNFRRLVDAESIVNQLQNQVHDLRQRQLMNVMTTRKLTRELEETKALVVSGFWEKNTPRSGKAYRCMSWRCHSMR